MKSSKTFRLFISSTFNDFREERKVLQTKVFPAIKEYCSEKGYRFQPIDLRWGINNEAQLDQKTLELCLDEVKTCKSYPHPNFLVMLGDRYGWIPLPYMIEQDEFDKINKLTSDKEKALLKEWYQLDENQLPASYILKHRKGKFEKNEIWNTVEKELLKILQQNATKANLTVEQLQKYYTSATEAEIIEGVIPFLKLTKHQKTLLDNNLTSVKEDTEFIFGFFRNIRTSSKRSEKFITDDYQKAQKLKTKVKEVLLKENVFECVTEQINEKDLDYSYLETFEKRIISFLKQKLDIHIKKETFYTELEIEKQEQDFFAKQKRKNFIGQETALKAIDDYIKNDNQQPFILYGKSGSGKSSIMAKAIENAKENSKSHILYRFVGATSNSSSSAAILTSIFNELGINIETKSNPDINLLSEKETFEQFSERINNKISTIKADTIIFIDAVDQLTNNDYFLWLPHIIPKNLKIIISSLYDENYEIDSIYFKTLKQITSNIFQVEQFNKPEELILNLLKKYNRRLQKHQLEYFLKQYSNSPTPLYIFVASQEIKYWKSFDLTEGQTPLKNYKIQNLGNSQKEIIEEFITNLSEIFHHDKGFVQKVLAYIYASKDGLSENEILELVNTDKTFIEKLAPETWHKNITSELPLVIWTRLYTQLKPFLSKKNQNNEELLFFFHREFIDVIKNSINQKIENENLIDATQKLISKYQYSNYFKNKWGYIFINGLGSYINDNYLIITDIIEKNPLLQHNWLKFFLRINYRYIESLSLSCFINFNKNILFTKRVILFSILHILYNKYPKKYYEPYITSLMLIGNYFSYNNEIIKAITYQRKALDILLLVDKNKLHKIKYHFIALLENISQNYLDIKLIKEAREFLLISNNFLQSLYEKKPAKWNFLYIDSLLNIGYIYLEENNYEKALDKFEKARIIIEKRDNIETDKYVEIYSKIYNSIGQTYLKKGEIEKGIIFQEKSVLILKENINNNKQELEPLYASSLNNLSIAYSINKEINKAIRVSIDAINIIEYYKSALPELYEKDYLSSLTTLSGLYVINKQYSLSITFGKKVLNLLKPLYKKAPASYLSDYSEILLILFLANKQKKKYIEAIHFLEQGINELERGIKEMKRVNLANNNWKKKLLLFYINLYQIYNNRLLKFFYKKKRKIVLKKIKEINE